MQADLAITAGVGAMVVSTTGFWETLKYIIFTIQLVVPNFSPGEWKMLISLLGVYRQRSTHQH
jgi:hypothetical protein